MFWQIAGGAAVIFGLLALIYKLEGLGRKTEQNEEMKQVLDDIHTANRARRRLDADAGFARRVRERFTR